MVLKSFLHLFMSTLLNYANVGGIIFVILCSFFYAPMMNTYMVHFQQGLV